MEPDCNQRTYICSSRRFYRRGFKKTVISNYFQKKWYLLVLCSSLQQHLSVKTMCAEEQSLHTHGNFRSCNTGELWILLVGKPLSRALFYGLHVFLKCPPSMTTSFSTGYIKGSNLRGTISGWQPGCAVHRVTLYVVNYNHKAQSLYSSYLQQRHKNV